MLPAKQRAILRDGRRCKTHEKRRKANPVPRLVVENRAARGRISAFFRSGVEL
jgi:hypothetical protein